MEFSHIPILSSEVCSFFKDSSGLVIDATLGLGGHSYKLLESNPNITIIGIDRDKEALKFAKERLSCFGNRFSAFYSNFSNGLKNIILEYKQINGILADIGISSYQLDNKNRGFGFYSHNLDMRMDLDSTLSAKDVVNSYTREQLNRIFSEYGEIKNPNYITKLILDYRKKNSINSAKSLSQLIEQNIKGKPNIHPATLVFQALRIEVNGELRELRELLYNMENLKNTKVAIISFHSLEDRIIKDRFKIWSKNCICNKDSFKCNCGNNNAKGLILTKKPVIPNKEEVALNKRSRSAKMRCFKFHV